MIQSLSNYLEGWFGAILGNNSPAVEDMNALHFLFSYQLAYGFQAGVPEWLDVTTYYKGSIVNIDGTLYKSITDDNTNEDPLTEEDDWSIFTTENTADGKDHWSATAPRGWVFADGRTIGSAASGATNRAKIDTFDLFKVLWDDFSNTLLPIEDSGGTPTTRGASAQIDFDNDKRMPVIDKRGRVSAGKDDMGGASANRMTQIDGDILGNSGGVDKVALTIANLPAHNHGGGSHTHTTGFATRLEDPQLNSQSIFAGGTDINVATASSGTIINTQGSNTTHSNIQPMIICNYILKL